MRRLAFGALVLATVGGSAAQALSVLWINGINPLEWILFLLFVILLVPIALSFWTACFGFVVRLGGKDPLALTPRLRNETTGDLPPFRTAVVMPVYNEDPARVYAGLKATYESLDRTEHLGRFDFFILSDTTDPDIWIREEMAFGELRGQVRDPARLHYRKRRENIDRKAGNIADFCARWGGRYRYMVVFDADSMMTGRSLASLVRLMEENPAVGIAQTPTLPVNRQSLFGRLQQFAARAYGPTFVAGLNFWQAGEGNYWGHNAIIRIRPFVEHCRLPKLPGKEPLGGSILSHDFVEAALMRRAGWKVYLAPELGGSYEEVPSTLIGHAARDRRWCQGNLQHARLLTMPGLNLISRIHLWMGIMAYVSSPLWMLTLALGTIEGLRLAWVPHAYFEPAKSLFPDWQISTVGKAILLFTSVMTLLILPKVMGLVVSLRDRRLLRGLGGAWKLTLSVALETLFSVLLAPTLAVVHSRFVIATLLGKAVEWTSQDRGDLSTTLAEALRRHAGTTLLGFLWSALLLSTVPRLFAWLSPVLAGFVLSVPLSIWSSKTSVGQWARTHGLFLTPEEVQPPRILRSFHQTFQHACNRPWAAPQDGLAWVLSDSQARSLHLALLPRPEAPSDPLRQHHLEGLRLKLLSAGSQALLPQEKSELLWDPASIRALSRAP